MYKKNRMFATAMLTAVALACLTGCKTKQIVNSPSKEKSIVIVYDNDVHCGIDGYAKMAGLRDAVRDTAWVALTSSGDFLQGGTAGAISKGQYVADVMKSMGYDAVSLGNHEFDYYVDRMQELINFANLPVTCVNLYDNATNKPVYPAYIMKTYGTKKVAFVGAVTTSTRYTEAYAFEDGSANEKYNLSEKDIYPKVQAAVDAARREGADYVVVISHLGESANVLNCDSHGLVAATRGIDVVLDGHTHSVVECAYVANLDGKKIPVTQTGTKFQNVGKLVITPQGQFIPQLVPLKDITTVNERVKAVTDSINALMEEVTKRTVCHSDYPLSILDSRGRQQVRYAEANAGDLVADAYISMTGADVAISNGGGIRSGLEAGDLTYGDILGMLPYDNYLYVVEVSGQLLHDVLEACCQFSPVENGDFPQVSGMSFTMDMKGSPRVKDLCVLNKQTGEYEPIDLNRTYTLATIDYCVTGGGLQSKLRNVKVLKESICRYNDALITYVTEKLNGVIPERYAKPQGRINIQQ